MTILKVVELGMGVGTEKAIGDGLRTGRGGSQVRERRGPRPSLHRIDTAALPAEDFVLPTDLLSSFSARSLSSSLA